MIRTRHHRARAADPVEQPIPWQDASTQRERRALMAAAGISRGDQGRGATIFGGLPGLLAGPPGPQAGRIAWPVKVRRHTETSAPLRALYPWLTSPPLPQVGPVIGRDVYAGGLFCCDLWQLRRAGLLSDTGVVISGTIGSGKSAQGKSFCYRNAVFGRPFVVPSDIRGEWVPLVRALGGVVMRLGPGMPHRLNALAMPPRPSSVPADQWWLTVRTHWEDLLVALIETIERGRLLSAIETTAIELALDDACRMTGGVDPDRAAPISLPMIVDRLLAPTAYMAGEMHRTVGELAEEIRRVGLALRKLTKGSLQGLVDSDSQATIDPARLATVIDLSRVQTSDVALALVMACTQAATEIAWLDRPQQRIHVYDEWWRLAPFGALIARQDAAARLSRKTGGATLLITHRHSDSLRGDDRARRAAADLIRNCATRVYYRQRYDALGELDVGPGVASILPKLARGQAVWTLDEKPYVVNHLLAPPDSGEPEIIETDQVMLDEYRTLADRSADDLFAVVDVSS